MAGKIPSNYRDIISQSVQICSGPPDVYQLKPKMDQLGTLNRVTVGEKGVWRRNKTILLVGETGAGKCTLINALLNYAMGVKWQDQLWFQIVEDRRSQTESQTADVKMYQIFGFKGKTLPFSLTIIDTPGFGDTKGPEHDVITSQKILNLLRSKDGFCEIDAVGLVMKASENRLTDRLKGVFKSVMSLFGNDLREKIVVLFTHSDGVKPKNALQALESANIKCARNEESQPVHFLFNNRQNEVRRQCSRELKGAFEMTQRGMSGLTAFLEKSVP